MNSYFDSDFSSFFGSDQVADYDKGSGFGLFDGGFFGGQSGVMFNVYFIIILTIITITFISIIASIIIRSRRIKKNNNLPQLTVQAKVIAKRTDISHYSNIDNYDNIRGSSYSKYYVTFEVEGGDRMELYTPGNDYGLLVEGDSGSLTFRGTDFISFKRI